MLAKLVMGLNDPFEVLVEKWEKQISQNGNHYLLLSLSDGRTKELSRYFDTEESLFEKGIQAPPCTAVVTIDKGEFQGKPSLKIRQIQPGTSPVTQFVRSAPHDSAYYRKAILERVALYGDNTVSGQMLKELVEQVYADNWDRLQYAAGGIKIHHAYRGGLLEHTLDVVWMCELLGNRYVDQVCMPVLLAGAALHDIGKLLETETDGLGTARLNLMGKFYGHLILGHDLLRSTAAKVNSDYFFGTSEGYELLTVLDNILLSHHGPVDAGKGSAANPLTFEARLVLLADEISMQASVYREAESRIEPYSVTNEAKWILGHEIYKPSFR